MRVTINGYVNPEGVFRAFTGHARSARPGEIKVTALLDIPDEAFEPRHLIVEAAASEREIGNTVEHQVARGEKPRIPRQIKPVEQLGHWTGPQLMQFMARNDLDYSDVARALRVDEHLVRTWTNRPGALRLGADHVATLNELNQKGQVA